MTMIILIVISGQSNLTCGRIATTHEAAIVYQFLHILAMAVARSSGGVATCFVLPVFLMTSYLHTVDRNRQRAKSIGPILKVTQQGRQDLTLRRILKLSHHEAAPERGEI